MEGEGGEGRSRIQFVTTLYYYKKYEIITVASREDFLQRYGSPRYCCVDYRCPLEVDLPYRYNPIFLCETYPVRLLFSQDPWNWWAKWTR